MKKNLLSVLTLMLALMLLTPVVSSAQSCGCDYTVGLTTLSLDNSVLNWPDGSTICLTSGTRNYLLIKNFQSASATQPFIFKNCGGQVVIASNLSYGISIRNSKNFVLTGTGDPSVEYGIWIQGSIKTTNPDVYYQTWGVSCEQKSTDFEIEHVKVSDAEFAGFGLKTDPDCNDASTQRDQFTMRNVFVHDNFVDGTNHGEGFYIGNSFYSNGKLCDDGVTRVYPHSIKGLRVYNNKTIDTGAEGIQVGCADEDSQIYNNRIENYGLRPFNNSFGDQGNGLQVGEGTSGSVYNNFIKAQTGIINPQTTLVAGGGGMKVFGIDNIVYNNIIIDPFEEGIFVDERVGSHTGTGSAYRFYNNTIVNSLGHGLKVYSEQVETNAIKNNVIILNDPVTYGYVKTLSGSVPLDTSNNWRVKTSNMAYINFVSTGTNDYHITSTSSAVDGGTSSVSTYGVTSDFDGIPRPQQTTYDIGAFEFVPEVEQMEVFINAGGLEYVDGSNTWEADQPHADLASGYINYATGSATSFSVPPKTNPTTAPKQVLGSYRYTNHNVTNSNTIIYNIPVTDAGDYQVELFWGLKNSDTGITTGQRLFNIYTEGTFITSYDVFTNAGTGSASSYTFTQTVSDGTLELKFVAATGAEAQINGIHVNGPLPPARLMADRKISPKVAEGNKEILITVSPNPASTYLEISGESNQSYSAKIFDMQQRSVGTYEYVNGSENSYRLDISHLKGNELYLLQVVSGSGDRKVLKFMKK